LWRPMDGSISLLLLLLLLLLLMVIFYSLIPTDSCRILSSAATRVI
jgi:hypothetical protein